MNNPDELLDYLEYAVKVNIKISKKDGSLDRMIPYVKTKTVIGRSQHSEKDKYLSIRLNQIITFMSLNYIIFSPQMYFFALAISKRTFAYNSL